MPTRRAALFLAYLALAVVATWPLALHPFDHVIGTAAPPGEATPPLNIWAMATVLQHLPFDLLHLFEGTAFYPYAHTLAFSEHLFVPALLSAPVVWLTGNWVLAYNVTMLLTLATAGFAMFLLAHELTDDAAASFAAGLLYAFHTWNINELVRSQITANQWFPLVLLALIRFFRAPGWRSAAVVGVFYALQSLSCMYWALYLPFLVAATVSVLFWRQRLPLRAFVPLVLCVGLALALTAPFAIPYLTTARELGFERPAEPPSVPIDRYFDVLPENLLYVRLLGTALRNQNAAHFLGFGAMALALVGVFARGPRERVPGVRGLLVLLVVAGFVLSLGPEIRVGETLVGPGPYRLLRSFVPGFRNVRYPERLSIALVLGLAPLVALGMARVRPRLGTVGLMLVAGFLFLEHLSLPRSLSYLPGGNAVPSVYRWLAGRSDMHVVAEVPSSPYRMERADALPMYLATVHGKRTLQGYTSYFAPTYNFIKWRLFHFPDPESVRFLQRFGADTVVVSPVSGAPPPWAGEDPRWERFGPFPEGHVVLRLKDVEAAGFATPARDDDRFTEIDRSGWQVRGSDPEAERAVDGDETTAWAVFEQPQARGAFYRIVLPRPERVARIVMTLNGPFQLPMRYEFPMRFKVLGEAVTGDPVELAYDADVAFDRLFGTLLHEPQAARMVIDLEPKDVSGLRIRINETDGFGLPWAMGEIRLYRKREP
jgi:hypothetical protein